MMFPDVPSMYFLGQIYHDVGVGDAAPVKQHRYRPNAIKQQYHKEEIKYLLADDSQDYKCFQESLPTFFSNWLKWLDSQTSEDSETAQTAQLIFITSSSSNGQTSLNC